MKVVKSERGFQFLMHPAYLPPHGEARLASVSSAIGDYEDAFDRPGSSYLWIGDDIHLNREEVAELVVYLQSWIATGKFIDTKTDGEK